MVTVRGKVADGRKQLGFRPPSATGASKFRLSTFLGCHFPTYNVGITPILPLHHQVAGLFLAKCLEQYLAHCKCYYHDYYVSMATKMPMSIILNGCISFH